MRTSNLCFLRSDFRPARVSFIRRSRVPAPLMLILRATRPLPVTRTEPGAGERSFSLTVRDPTFVETIFTLQPATPTTDWPSDFAPFWPRIDDVTVSGAAHRSLLADSAELAP